MKRIFLLFSLLVVCINISFSQTTEPASVQSATTLTSQTTDYIQSEPDQKTTPAPKRLDFSKSRVPLSGIVLTPTAYRGRGDNSIGLGLDFNAAYYIGRLYGKNKFDWTLQKTNYIDRVGVWLLQADAKMLIQSEGKLRPAMSAGAHGIFQLRDASQPSLNQPGVSINVDSKNTNSFASAYLALSKRPHPRLILNLGYSDGDSAKIIYELSEYLSKEAMKLNGYNNPEIPSGVFFGGFIWLLKPNYPVGVEVMIPQGAPQKPKLINIHLGALLKLNFELSYLMFEGGWDLLGMFQFRYSYFPK